MTMRRMLTMTGGAVAPLAVLALLFGNQWVIDGIVDSGFELDEGIGPLVGWLFLLGWRFTPPGGLDWRLVLSSDFSLIVFFVVLVLLVLACARLADLGRAPLGAVIAGWWATVVAGGVSGFVNAPLSYWALDLDGGLGRNFFTAIGQGAAFGLAFGWIAGLGALGGLMLSRPREAGAQPRQPFGAPQPYAAQQPGMPAQHAYQQQPMQQHAYQQQPMQQHPSAVPYVPPQGQPQQPGWGAAAVPQPQQPGPPPAQPQPQAQFGAPPVPQQPPAPPQEQPAAAPAESDEPTQDDADHDARTGADHDAEDDAPAGAPEDAPEDGDLDLADRTIIDRKPDGEDT